MTVGPANAVVDATRSRISIEPPKHGGVTARVPYIDEFHGRLESEAVKRVAPSDRTPELAQTKQTDDQMLAAADLRETAAEGAPDGGGCDPNTPARADAADLPLQAVAMNEANDEMPRGKNGKIHLPDGTELYPDGTEYSHLAIPRGQETRAVDRGARSNFDENTQGRIRAATGAQHQLIIKGVRDLGGGQCSIDVVETWTGNAHAASGEQLISRYTTGIAKREAGSARVELADGMTPNEGPVPDQREAQVRNPIESQQPQQLPELARIEKITDALDRSVLMQILLHRQSVEGTKPDLLGNLSALHHADTPHDGPVDMSCGPTGRPGAR